MLKPFGFNIFTARNGVEALAQTEANKPDLILLDVMMPMMDGFTVCKRLRAKASTQDVPILILSTSALRDSIQKGMRAGATKYLFKPIKRESLLQEVAGALHLTPSLLSA